MIIPLWTTYKFDTQAVNDFTVKTVYLDETSYITIQENKSCVVSSYYKNGKKFQDAFLDKESGAIVYKEYAADTANKGLMKLDGKNECIRTEKYNVNDLFLNIDL